MRVRFLEKSAIDKKKTASPRNEPATEELQYGAAKEGEMAAEGPSRKLHEIYTAADGDYVRVVGDPYPYSRQHFEKWRMPREDIQIGYIPSRKQHTLASPVSDVNFDMQPPVRKMPHYDCAYVTAIRQGKDVRD